MNDNWPTEGNGEPNAARKFSDWLDAGPALAEAADLCIEVNVLPLIPAVPDAMPMDGTPIYIRTVQPYRFLPYKPNSQQFKRGEKGRWQAMNEYGGWDNCSHPIGNEWSLDHPFTEK